MKQVYYDYDVYPKVFLGDREKTVTVKPLGINTAFAKDKAYTVEVLKVNQGNARVWPERSGRATLSVTPDADGCLRVTAYFEGEGEYYLNINDGDRRLATLPVYCLAEDMAGRIPQRGDLHVHTCRSDGHDDPVNVVSNYRGHGYDFMVISDHNRYYPPWRPFSVTAVSAISPSSPARRCICPTMTSTTSTSAAPTPSTHWWREAPTMRRQGTILRGEVWTATPPTA